MKNFFKLQMLLGVFVSVLIAMNVLGIKIISIFGISASAGIFMVPFAFLIADVVAEVYGKKEAKAFVWVGLVALTSFFVLSFLCVHLTSHPRFTLGEQYDAVFSFSFRTMLASIFAFLLSQFNDIWTFEFLKKKTQGKMLWLRNNISTWTAQLIDTLLFMFIALYAITPQFDALFVLQLTWPYYLFKVLFAILETPFVYIGAKWLRGGEKIEEVNTHGVA